MLDFRGGGRAAKIQRFVNEVGMVFIQFSGRLLGFFTAK